MKNVRLSAHIVPERYQIILKPDLEAFTFEGSEVVYLDIKRATKKITLHSKELDIETVNITTSTSAKATVDKPSSLWAAKIQYDEKSETVTFKFHQQIPKGRIQLHLAFRGILNDKMRGFYRSKFTYKGKEKFMATTQFEATDARRAFPCVDEPAAKAVFDVTLIVPGSSTAISNTLPTEIKEHEGGYKVVQFSQTPRMSTYLLAFIVGDFEFIEGYASPPPNLPHPGGGGKQNTLVRVFVTPGKKHQAKFALDCAIKMLEFYNKYFNIPYPLPVLDLIAIPDFASGAMENWGAVTYRESALLVDPEHSSASNKQWVALVIAHELAHQWFGNLVTMEWWTHLWLNEGFASYIEYLAVDHMFPQWDIWTQFAYADLGVALKLDALNTTHPIEIEVYHPDEIGEIFDEVSYSKGACVIRMLADYLGEKDFRDGLRYYLKKHSYFNASTIHLWQAFEKVSKKPVEKIMKNWTSKPGYPLIQVSEKANKLQLTQSRFYSSIISKQKSKDKTLWQVPVKVERDSNFAKATSDKKGKGESLLLNSKQTTINVVQTQWVKVNPGESGFFRTAYSSKQLSELRKPIEQKKLAPIDRLGIVRDAFALSEAGQLSTVEALKLIKSFAREDDYTVWVELASGLDTLNSMLFGTRSYENFKLLNQSVFKDIGQKVGWEKKKSESHTHSLLRSLVLHHLGYYGHKETVLKAKKQFKNGKIHADLRGAVYSLVAGNGDKVEFEKLKAMYIKETLHEEKNRLGRALGAFRKPAILQKSLAFSLSNNVRPQDSPSIIVSAWVNPYGREVAWKFVKKNWKKLLERYGEGGHMLPRLIKVASFFNTVNQLNDFKKFFKKNPAPGAARAITQVVEKIESNIAWAKKDLKNVEEWLRNGSSY